MSLKIGHLTGFFIVKALPDHDSYLCKLMDTQFFALLPKRWTRKEYKIGESDWAAIFDLRGPRITLSQKSPHYVRKILEYLLSYACRELNLKFKKVAWVNGFPYRKAAMESLDSSIEDSFELFKALKPYLEEIKLSDYFNEEISFVTYSRDIREYVVNALCPPGKRDGILKVIHHSEMNQVNVLADSTMVGQLLGTKARNLITAKKLCQCEIEIKPVSMETFLKFKQKEE